MLVTPPGMILKRWAKLCAPGLKRILESSYTGKSGGSGFRSNSFWGARSANYDVQLHIGESRDSGFAPSVHPGMTKRTETTDADHHSIRRHQQGAAGLGGVGAGAAC